MHVAARLARYCDCVLKRRFKNGMSDCDKQILSRDQEQLALEVSAQLDRLVFTKYKYNELNPTLQDRQFTGLCTQDLE